MEASTRGATQEELRQSIRDLFSSLPAPQELLVPYDGSLAQRAAVRSYTSNLIRRYIIGTKTKAGGPVPAFVLNKITPGKEPAREARPARLELDMLKRLTWEYATITLAWQVNSLVSGG